MKFPEWATSVTPLSKTIALVLFITLPIIAFYFGLTLQQKVIIIPTPPLQYYPTISINQPTQTAPPISTIIPISTPIQQNPTISPFITTTSSCSAPEGYCCFAQASDPYKKGQIVKPGGPICKGAGQEGICGICRMANGECGFCLCLSVNTEIATPNGGIPVQQLAVGALVWTVDRTGKKQFAHIAKVGKTAAGNNHHIIELVLADGRRVSASPLHPTADGRFINDLSIGEIYDGSKITRKTNHTYSYPYTYDILPDGDTGFYFANGILMGSTLK